MRRIGPVFLLLIFCLQLYAQDYSGVSYGPEDRQFVDIYLADSEIPSPVYFNAHSNGGSTNMPGSITNDLTEAGIAVVSWESLTSINNQEQVEIGWADAELMFQWVIDNADTYNFDTTQLIVGGSSRGTILSWVYGHRPNPSIKGLYMYNALPDGIWAFPEWWTPTQEVNIDSPPIFFLYRFEPGTTDSHDPENGIIITDLYDSLGIGDRYTLVHSIVDTDNTDRYQFLLEFALSVLDLPLSVDQVEAISVEVFPNPVQDQLNFKGLKGNETFTITSSLGQRLQITEDPTVLDVSSLSSGLYFLHIQNESGNRVVKLIKR